MRAAIVLLLGAPACFDPGPAPASCVVTCSEDAACPGDLECDRGLCRNFEEPACCLRESFDAPLSAAKWAGTVTPGQPSPFDVPPEADGGQLPIAIPVNANWYAGINSAFPVDLGDGAFEVELVEIADGSQGFVETGIAITRVQGDAGNGYFISNGQTFAAVRNDNGNRTFLEQIAIDRTAQRFARIRFDLETKQAIWEVSPDRVVWSHVTNTDITTATEALFVGVYAGSFLGGRPEPGAARFDALRAVAPTCL